MFKEDNGYLRPGSELGEKDSRSDNDKSMSSDLRISRRSFLKSISWGTLGVALSGLGSWGLKLGEVFGEKASPIIQSRVVLVKNRKAMRAGTKVPAGDRPDEAIIRQMMVRGMQELTGKSSVAAAWRTLVSPRDVVGIKVNPLGGPNLFSDHEVVAEIIEGLKAAGVKENNIIIWDRFERQMRKVGYKLNLGSQGVKCYATDSAGIGYEPEEIDFGSGKTRLSKILTRQVTALINVPVLKDHNLSGVTICLKNLAYGSIPNSNEYHHQNCDPFIPEVYALPSIRGKVRLHICDGLRAVYNGGPFDKPQWKWNENTLFFSTDPVALDQVGLEIIEGKRKSEGYPSLAKVGHPAKHIATAAGMGLGTNDHQKIDLVQIDISA